MTPVEVHNVSFRKPPIGERGYDEGSVDKLLDLIERTLRGDPKITRDDLRSLTFGHLRIGKRGYRKQDVDAFLQQIVEQLPETRGAL